MQTILNRAAIANSVAPQFLEYAGFQDESHTVGKILYHFTIMDPAHRRYKSTVAHIVVLNVSGRDRTHRRAQAGRR